MLLLDEDCERVLSAVVDAARGWFGFGFWFWEVANADVGTCEAEGVLKAETGWAGALAAG